MLWELIATVSAGLGAAGVALMLRFFTAQKLPRWSIPVFAGGAMLAFQIYSEYHWFTHQKSLLPEDVHVVRAVQTSTAWRPWTYAFPQTVRFIAVRVGESAINRVNPDLVLAEVYLFERRLAARLVPQVFHCREAARAHMHDSLVTPSPGEPLDDSWLPLPSDDPLLRAVCHKAMAGVWP